MNDFLGWRVAPKIAQAYVNEIEGMVSDENKFNSFRSINNNYKPILEHLTQKDGTIYYNHIKEKYPHLLPIFDRFKENDKIGNPLFYQYGNEGMINPTTLRYIKFLGDIENRFGNLNGFNLVEIGGGYGGLVRILSTMYDFNSIKLFDLPQPLKLQKKYLSKFDIDVETHTINDDFEIDDKTIVISNYAWCECDKDIRDKYLDKIIKKSELIYMVVYGIDIEQDLMLLDGDKNTEPDILNGATIYTNKTK